MSLPFSVPGLSNTHPSSPTPRAPVEAPAVPAQAAPVSRAPAPVAEPVPVVEAAAAPVAAAVPVPSASPSAPPSAAVPAAVPAAVAPAVAPAPAPGSPEALYAGCFTRLEEPQRVNECGMDSDCVVAGCSAEVCVPYNSAASVMTACTTQACFQVLDHCGCHAGLCNWTLKAAGAPKSPVAADHSVPFH